MSNKYQFEITKEIIHEFASISGDFNSLHINKAYGKKSAYGDNVAHGIIPILLVLAKAFKDYQNKKTAACLSEMFCSFVKPVLVGDIINASFELSETIDDSDLYHFKIIDSNDAELITHGKFKIISQITKKESFQEPEGKLSEIISIVHPDIPEKVQSLKDIHIGSGYEFNFNSFRLSNLSIFNLANIDSKDIAELNLKDNYLSTQLIFLCALSTSVGMFMPGRYATFSDFKIKFKPFVLDTNYKLIGEVVSKNETASMIKKTVKFLKENNEEVAVAKLSVKLLEPKAALIDQYSLAQETESFGLQNKVALITGSSRGVGSIIAKYLSSFGVKIVINYLANSDAADAVVKSIISDGGEAIAIKADVSDEESVKDMFSTIDQKYGKLDILVNNAVSGYNLQNFDSLSWDDFNLEMNVVVKGAFICSQFSIPLMEKSGGGKIVNISTQIASYPIPKAVKYVTIKSALEGLTRSMALDLAKKNIHVNSISPSMMQTDLTNHVSKMEFMLAKKSTPLGRNAEPLDVAKCVLFLCSSLSSFTTGQNIKLTGGNPPF